MSGLSRSAGDRAAARDALVGRQRRTLLDLTDEQIEGVLRVRQDVLERRKEILVGLDVVAVLHFVQAIRRLRPVRITRLRGETGRDCACVGAGVVIDRQQRVLGTRDGDQRSLDQTRGREGIELRPTSETDSRVM